MKIKINMGHPLGEAVGESQITLGLPASATVADALAQLRTAYPGFGEALAGEGSRQYLPFLFFVNRRWVKEEDLAGRTLKEGDTLHILTPTVGG
jgi:sulfur carrier protein ThiS